MNTSQYNSEKIPFEIIPFYGSKTAHYFSPFLLRKIGWGIALIFMAFGILISTDLYQGYKISTDLKSNTDAIHPEIIDIKKISETFSGKIHYTNLHLMRATLLEDTLYLLRVSDNQLKGEDIGIYYDGQIPENIHIENQEMPFNYAWIGLLITFFVSIIVLTVLLGGTWDRRKEWRTQKRANSIPLNETIPVVSGKVIYDASKCRYLIEGELADGTTIQSTYLRFDPRPFMPAQLYAVNIANKFHIKMDFLPRINLTDFHNNPTPNDETYTKRQLQLRGLYVFIYFLVLVFIGYILFVQDGPIYSTTATIINVEKGGENGFFAEAVLDDGTVVKALVGHRNSRKDFWIRIGEKITIGQNPQIETWYQILPGYSDSPVIVFILFGTPLIAVGFGLIASFMKALRENKFHKLLNYGHKEIKVQFAGLVYELGLSNIKPGDHAAELSINPWLHANEKSGVRAYFQYYDKQSNQLYLYGRRLQFPLNQYPKPLELGEHLHAIISTEDMRAIYLEEPLMATG